MRVYFTLVKSPVDANSVVEQARRERDGDLRLVNSL